MKFVLLLIGGYGIFTIVRILFQFHLFDFAIYYQAVQDLQHGLSMYLDQTIAMKYPMSAMILLSPIGWLPYNIAEKLWTLLSLLSLGLSLWWLAKMLPELKRRHWIYIVAAIILSFPYKFTLGMGQINLMILACFSFSLYAYFRGYDILAGIPIALAAWLKITPLVLLLFFLRKGKYKTIVAAVVVYALGWVVAGQVWGWQYIVEFVTQVVPSISTLGNSVYYNQAFTGVIARLGISDQIGGMINYGALAIMLLASYFVTPKEKVTARYEIISFGLFIISMLLGAGLAWQHYFVWLIIPFIGMYASLLADNTKNNNLLWYILLLAYILISVNIASPGEWLGVARFTLSHVTYGTIIAWFLCLKLTQRNNHLQIA